MSDVVVEAPAETRIAADAEIGAGENHRTWWGGRVSAARSIAPVVDLGVEAAWGKASSSTQEPPVLADEERGRALAFFSLRSRKPVAEVSLSAGFGIMTVRTKTHRPENSYRVEGEEWRAIEPTLAAGSWAGVRFWIVRPVGFELELGALFSRGEGTRRQDRLFVDAVARSGFAVRF